MCLSVYIWSPNSESPNIFEKQYITTGKANEITPKSYCSIAREKKANNFIYVGKRGLNIQNWQSLLLSWPRAEQGLLEKQGGSAMVLVLAEHR